jgi:hypothetical protein
VDGGQEVCHFGGQVRASKVVAGQDAQGTRRGENHVRNQTPVLQNRTALSNKR